MNEKWNKRFAKLEPWIAKDPESPMRLVVAHLMVQAKEDFENIGRYWDSILLVGRGQEDWPICRCGRCIMGESE